MVLSFLRRCRGLAVAFLTLAVLAAPASPRVAYAAPIGPGDQCVPQPVTAANAELIGTLQMLEAAAVGSESHISIYPASLRIPDPNCDGRYITVLLAYRWDLLSRPSGSNAQLSPTTGSLVTRLTPDVAGDWQVAFTACPFGCKVIGTSITIQPLRRTISFTSSLAIEGRLGTELFDNTLHVFLGDSRIQISHTGAGGSVASTPHDVAFYPLTPQYQRHCLDVPEPPADCDDLLATMLRNVTLHTITPTWSSFIDFGPVAEERGAPSFIALPIEPHEHDVPTWKRAIFVGLQSLFTTTSIDIDRARVLSNNIHLDLADEMKWRASIGNGGLHLKLSFDSDHPTIKCEGHYIQRVGFIFSIGSGWADELCPDYNLGQMEMTIHVFPTVQDESIVVDSITVDVQLAPDGVQSDLIDVFTDVSAEQEVKIANKVRARLLEPDNRAKLGAVLMKVLQHHFPDLKRVSSSRIVGSDWLVRYERS